MFKNSDEAKKSLKWFARGKGLEFNYLNFDQAYEYAVLEYPFSFWQYGHDCTKIPSDKQDLETQIQHLLDIVGLSFYSDADMESYGSHYYQSGTEMGYYGYETEDFKEYLEHLPTDKNPSAAFAPNKVEMNFDGTLTNKVFNWAKNANKIIYINGALDTWSATAVPPCKNCDSIFFFMEDKHHANARIKNMTDEEKTLLKNTLSAWLGFEVK